MADTEAKVPLSVAVRDAITAAYNEHADDEDKGIVVKWLLIMDVMPGDPESGRYIRMLGDDDTPIWDRVGMLDFASNLISAVDDDDED